MDNRFGNIVADEIDRAIDDNVPENTKKTNNCVWNQFAMFCEAKHYLLSPTSTDEEIAHILKDWAYNMKRKNGQDYKERVVKIMWNVTAKRVQETFYKKYKRVFDPFYDITFKAARDARDAKRKQLQSRQFTLSYEQSLQMVNLWDEDTPIGLIRKFYHIATAELGWTHWGACHASVLHFKEEVDARGNLTGRIEYNPSFCKNAKVTPGRPIESEWLEPNRENSNLCPVRLFKKYLSKRGPNIYTDRLFLTVNHQSWERGNIWYRNSPVGKNEIRKWIREAAEKIGLDTKRNKFTIRSLLGTLAKKPSVGQRKTVLFAEETTAEFIKLEAQAGDDDDDDCQIVEEAFQGPSTSTSYSRNETNESTYSITDEDSTAEDMYQDDGDGDGDIEGDVEGDGEGEVDEKKTDLLDISDTRILQDAVEPLRVEVDRELPSPGECELFGEYIARHLQNLPISVALKLQSGIHNLVMQTRLEYIRDHPSEAPAMVKQEPLLEENEEEDSRPPNTETPTNQPVSDKPVQIRPEKRPPNTDPPEPKRFKPDSSRSETQKSSASTTHGQQKKRTDCAVFAEHIALQLEQLPEEISLQLQSDIYALITQACPKPADEGAPPHRVKIKAETVDAMPIELINEYYDNV